MGKHYSAANAARRLESIKRQIKAQELKQAGKGRDEIARELGVTIETARRMMKGNYRALLERVSAASRAKAEAGVLPPSRHTVSGTVRGCPTTVTADTAEQAQALLGRMA